MKVVFDARCISSVPSGTSVYVRELLRRLPDLEKDWDWQILFKDKATADGILSDVLPGGRANVQTSFLPYSFSSIIGKFKLAAFLYSQRCDLYFSPIIANSFLALLKLNSPSRATVVAVHRHPDKESSTPLAAALRRYCLWRAANYCTAIIAVSRALRKDIITSLHLSGKTAERIKCIYSGVSDTFAPPSVPRKESKTKVILYVGNQKPYKNIGTLIRAFNELRRDTGTALHLLLIGPEASDAGRIRNLVKDLGLNDNVTFAQETSEADLISAYREASLLVSPSSYEGFSFPLLEAMRCGTPVVCCDGGAQAELTGDAAEPVQPGDMQSLCNAMKRVLEDAGFREKSVRAGFAKSAEFSWDKTAAETLAVFRGAVNGKSSNGGAR